ncbi:hypothetical protein [Enterococcus massiliensis]|uniref:hypothetical protein n=1 Tax=Enterococcus massiliensis TaxID=1640685 RepID=UPI00065DE580|nr:hypothetical protein [Enterococcus massiliensis]
MPLQEEKMYATLIISHAEMAMDYFSQGSDKFKRAEFGNALRLLKKGQVCLNVACNLEMSLFYLEKEKVTPIAMVIEAKEYLTTVIHWGRFFAAMQKTLEREI